MVSSKTHMLYQPVAEGIHLHVASVQRNHHGCLCQRLSESYKRNAHVVVPAEQTQDPSLQHSHLPGKLQSHHLITLSLQYQVSLMSSCQCKIIHVYFCVVRAHLFAWIEFLEIIRKVFLKVTKIEEIKAKIHLLPGGIV